MKTKTAIMYAAIAVAATTLTARAAEVTGSVKLDGAAPKMKKIKMDADPKCLEMHADAPVHGQEVEVGDGGALQDVFVYVKSGLEGKTFPVPTEAVEIDQQGCMYHPHVLGMMAKQQLKIKNADDTLHNIHAMPANSKEFNLGQPNQGMESTRTFANPEIMVHVKCDVHPWMSAYIGVVDNPFFAVTGADGKFAIKGLPAGTYEIAAWQEKLGTQTMKVTVGESDTKTADFSFKAAE
jgi:hypothetical protein